ncbi:hypothetical protein [Galbibacter mesophilus]|uniref:hypothetical protein n=1 Tax=Galbibacter mesophilus TaxID=379069 RepID=UPI00191EEB15|nr:hypothetical protein [Galbibacter mesophilus]MCM5664205.1 hypothetical protein [Galbibacter mesophilus]
MSGIFNSIVKRTLFALLIIGLVNFIYSFSRKETKTTESFINTAPPDTDGDGLTDDIDKDDDNDGIPDLMEDECEITGNFGPPPSRVTSSNAVTAIYSDYQGYWSSSTTNLNPKEFDNHSTLLAFEANGKTYATGVPNARLKDTNNNGRFDRIDTNNDGTGDKIIEETTWVAVQPVTRITNGIRLEARALDGNLSQANGPLLTSGGTPFNPYLYEGVRGLDMAYTIANIGNTWTFRLGGTTSGSYGDGIMDILLTQGALLTSGSNYNRLHLLDANGNYLGNGVEVIWNNIPEVGFSIVDQYNVNDSRNAANSKKGLRFAAVELSEFNLTETQKSQAVAFRLEISSGADPIFFAVNEGSFTPGCISIDTDGDGIANSLDLDSDNDGIYDAVEAGHGKTINSSGRVTGAVGADGIPNSVQATTQPDSGNINYNILDSDNNNIADYISLDSDADGCNDVLEAGFTDPDGNGFLGNNPISVNAAGVVTGQGGYTAPKDNNTDGKFDYRVASQRPTITTQPKNTTFFDGNAGTLNIASTHTTAFQWQVSINGGPFNDITDGPLYAGTNTNTLTVKEADFSMQNYQYRAVLTNSAYVCNSQNISTAAVTKVGVKTVISNRNQTYRVNKDTP